MILYHGSKNKFELIKPHQATAGEGVIVPESELQNAIYLSTNYEFALAMCSMPEGLTHVDNDKMTIETEHPEEFDPNEPIYIYEIDLETIPKEKLEYLSDGRQVVAHLDELKFDSRKELQAGEVLKYYRLIGYENREGVRNEIKTGMKLR
jgi:hypothetical protein